MVDVLDHRNNVGAGRRVLERRGLGGYSVVYVNDSFVVVRVRARLYRVLPNAHADDPEAFSEMLNRSAELDAPTYERLSHARGVARRAHIMVGKR
jgi:hypothetical protein